MPNPAQWKSGLSRSQVNQARKEFGDNTLPQPKNISTWQLAVTQIKNPLIIVLLAAAAMTFFLRELADTAIILIAVGINTTLGFFQERRALLTLDSLKKLIIPLAWVIRSGQESQVESNQLVPGDLVTLKPGDVIPADGVIVAADNLWVAEAVLTGESASVPKKPLKVSDEVSSHSIAEMYVSAKKIEDQQRAFMGATVVAGQGQCVITKTGSQTELGKLAQQVSEHATLPTPLEVKLRQLAKSLTLLIVFLAGLIWLIGLYQGQELFEMLKLATALAVSAIPEGLTISLTALLALTMQRVLRKKGLVKQLMTAETLGRVTTVCLDKTGTLTKGVLEVVTTKFTNEAAAVVAAQLANDRRDPLDLVRQDWARDWASTHKKSSVLGHKAESVLPFSSKYQFVAALEQNTIHVVGAPEKIVSMSKLSSKERAEWMELLESWTDKGYRVIAFAHYKSSSDRAISSAWKRLTTEPPATATFLGLMALADPIRTSLKSVFKETAEAGLKTLVITGDHAATAKHVMQALDLAVSEDTILEGHELEQLSDEELTQKLQTVSLFARTSPSQKLRIVNLLKKQGEVVAMMGDGVNDAPALSAADIGIAVNNATEVAREAASFLLLKNSFKIIVYAIKQGRIVVANLRKIVLYLLSDTFAEISIVVVALLLGWPVPLTAAQILWINLVNDGFPSLALIVDPVDDPLKTPARSLDSPLIDNELQLLITIISGFTSLSLIGLMQIFLDELSLIELRSLLFTTLSVHSLIYVFSCRNLEKPIWLSPPWRNPWLVLASAAGLSLTAVALYIPFFQNLLGVTALSAWEWLIVAGMGVAVIAWIELTKGLFHAFRKKPS